MTKIQKTALVTGGSRGIGKAIAEDFSKNGIDVVVTGRDKERLRKTAEELETYGGSAFWIDADLGTDSGVDRIYGFLKEKKLEANVLVNNAAIIHLSTHLIDFDMEKWQEVINVNLIGAVKITKLLLPGMVSQNYGKIINISSIGGRKGSAGRSAYRVTKAGLISFTESLAAEVKSSGIDVNCICPGSVVTEGYVEAFGQKSIENDHMMHPSEIASLCTFLVGEHSSAVTGAIIDAYGPSNPLFR
ncbi:MAG: SDR family NAD(P)-dependent oxidoreductase [Dehalococcoidia bacterium]